MRRTTRPAPRGGFTLIELLVVISIIGLLVGLTLAGIGTVRSGQMSKATDQTLIKLQKAADAQWKAVADGTRPTPNSNTIPPTVLTLCGGDKDRAAALWTYMNLRNEFPQTFAEANADVTVTASGTPPPTHTLLRRKTFASVPATTGLTAQQQAAVLLYINLVEKGVRGVTFSADDVTGGAKGEVVDGSARYKVFTDAWGTPIAFHRFYSGDEVQVAPYANPKTGSNAPSLDLIDPLQKLNLWPDTAGRTSAQNAVFVSGSGVGFGTRNKMLTVYSAGADKTFGAGAADYDTAWGYRLTKLGSQGN